MAWLVCHGTRHHERCAWAHLCLLLGRTDLERVDGSGGAGRASHQQGAGRGGRGEQSAFTPRHLPLTPSHAHRLRLSHTQRPPLLSSHHSPATSPASLDSLPLTPQAPARIDLAGGWSDTPPLSFEMGGEVTNVAVLLQGKRPMGARVGRRIYTRLPPHTQA